MERNGYMSLTNAKREDRLIGLDILRILSMVLITLRHYIGYAGLSELTDFFSFNGIAVRMLDILSGSAVNIFVLISGYFLIHSDFKWKRAIKIWGETFFIPLYVLQSQLHLAWKKLHPVDFCFPLCRCFQGIIGLQLHISHCMRHLRF